MIEHPVLLILGAGASKPYGFPLGGSLTTNILDELKNQESDFTKNIVHYGFEWNL